MTATAKASLRAAVERVQARSNTNLGGGLLAGLDHARVARLPEGMPVRVILFTDGLANAGPAKRPEELRALLEANRGETTVSAFGYGDDADQELLRELSDLGRGNYAYVRGPEDALTAFARELGGLLSTCAQRITINVKPQLGLAITDVVSDVDATGTEEGVALQVPELLADEVRHVVLAVMLAPRPVPLDAPAAVADVEVSYQRVEGGRVADATDACKVLARFVALGEEQRAPDPELDRAVAIAELVRVQIEAEEVAREGRYEAARDVTTLFQSALVTRGHDAVAAAAGKLAGAVGDAAAFERSRAYRSSLRKGATRSVASTYELGADADLRAMGRGGETEAQRRMERAFSAGARSPSGAPPTPGIHQRRSRRW
jgi:Ca-activated chloride channel family protein